MRLRPTPLILSLAALCACGGQPEAQGAGQNLYHVVREDLPLTVKENAELQAIRQTVLRSEVEGSATLIYLIDEGSKVTEGTKLFELDVSQLVEKRASQEISVGKAKSAWEQARTQQNILEKELTTKRNTALSQLTIAEMELEKLLGAEATATTAGRNGDMVRRLRDLILAPATTASPSEAAAENEAPATTPAVTKVDPRSYADLVDKVVQLLRIEGRGDPLEREMGKLANDVLQQADQIRLAMAQLKIAEDKVMHSRRLAAKNFITRNELERDELDYQSQESRVTIAWKDLELLINYTLPTERIQLEQNLANAQLELERVKASNDAERKKSEFDIIAKEKEYVVAKERLDNLIRQIDHAVGVAPTPGVVVYARLNRDRRSSESVSEGVQIRERQPIIILPDNTRMRCDVKVQEAQVDHVAVGQRAHITVEAFPNEVFTGHVTRVAPVADSGSSWGGTDKKVYTTIVDLDGTNKDGRLRARMAAAVTITIGDIKDTITVPQQSVRRDRSVNYVWKKTPSGPKAVAVKVGAHNQEKVQILEGVTEGDIVYRAPPGNMPQPRFEQPDLPEQGEAPTDAKTPPAKSSAETERQARAPSGARGGRGARKNYADMTPEELAEARTRLERMSGMADRIEDEAAATSFRRTLGQLRKALDASDFETAQTCSDRLGKIMRAAFRGGRRMGRGR